MRTAEATRMMAKLAAFFPGTPDVTIAAYASRLLDVELDEMAVAVDFFATRSHGFPGLWQIREYIRAERQARPGLPGRSEDVGASLPAAPARFAAKIRETVTG